MMNRDLENHDSDAVYVDALTECPFYD